MRSTADTDRLLEDAHRTVEMARLAGAEDVIASVAADRSTQFEWRDGRIEKVQEDASRGLSVALYVDGRYSTHATNDLERESLEAFLREAVQLTRELAPDPHRQIPDPRLYAPRSDADLGLVDARVLALRREDRLDACRELEAAAHADPAVISATSFFSDGHTAAARVASNGFEGVHEVTSVWYGATATIDDEGERRPEATRYVGGTHLEGLVPPPRVGAEALERALSRRGAAKVSSRRTNLILHPEAGPPLVGRVFGVLRAASIQQKHSFLPDHLGKRIAAGTLTVEDDPFLPRALGSRHYDGEGIASTRRPVLEDGVLRTYFVDTYYGRKLGWAPTTGGPSNLVFGPGPEDLAGILREVGEGIHVTSWLGGNANATTGDFSFGIRGFVVQGGRLGAPVSEMNVTGNYADLLHRISHVGNDPVPWATCRTPTLVFRDVQFSGA